MIFVKTIGVLFLFLGCAAGGFHLSSRLTKRRKSIHEICVCIGEISHLIEMGEERSRIINKVFLNTNLKVKENENYTVTVSCESLKKEDIHLLNEYFSRFGISDTQSQTSLCETYKKLFENLFNAAKEEERLKGQMYKTCGVLMAVALVIFVI